MHAVTTRAHTEAEERERILVSYISYDTYFDRKIVACRSKPNQTQSQTKTGREKAAGLMLVPTRSVSV